MIPVVLSGGSGTRLWPLSRARFPKQFCELLDESLLAKTLKRLTPLAQPWILTITEQEVLTARIFREMQIPLDQILMEPMGRNTAPAIALLCRIFEIRGLQDEIIGVFPADHLVRDESEFHRALSLAEACAKSGFVATLGIRPSYPATGFGYIEVSDPILQQAGSLKAHQVRGFREKPDLDLAEQFLNAKTFFWNAGIFVFQVRAMIQNFIAHLPEVWQGIANLRPDLTNLSQVYSSLPKISIDYGIMEKLSAQVCIPCDIGWSDLGCWDDVATAQVALANQARVVQAQSKDCFVFSSTNKAVGLVGVENLMIVDTPDALLVCKQGQTQAVRGLVDQLLSAQDPTAHEHGFELRPWGRFSILRDELHFKSKLISVDPQAQLSYQSHTQRSEQWVIVRGVGEVVLNETVHPVRPGDSIHIPVGAKHRIRNTGTELLEFVEVQTGSYFGEDDIIRYQDDYNRLKS